MLYPKFVNDQQHILDIIVSDYELDNIVFGLYLYETTKPGIHRALKVIPPDSIVIKQKETSDLKTLFNKLQAFILKEHGIKISCSRLIRKRGIDLINSYSERLTKISISESLVNLINLIQIFLKDNLFFIYPQPNFLGFVKDCVEFLNGLQLSKVITSFFNLIPSMNVLLILNSVYLPFGIKIKHENKDFNNSEMEVNFFLLDAEKYKLNNELLTFNRKQIQTDFNVDRIFNFNIYPILTFLIELFETEVPATTEKLKILLQKALYGIRTYDINWNMYPKPKINNFLLRFLIRLLGMNLNLKKISHWAIPEFLFDICATFLGLNASLLLILTDKNKDLATKIFLIRVENGSIIEFNYVNKQEIRTKIDVQSLESVRLTISDYYSYISHVLMVDIDLIKSILNDLLFNFHKISIFSLLKIIKKLKNPRFFRMYPEIPPYILLKKKNSFSFLREVLSIVIDRHEF
ncbi:MAG: hypothetical protein EAX91_11275 [Candidatus Lokiarchaeota archaeon]|nr:hypothetical protein [Candidatus Lokiarchaeota archaeon]